jgi:hypothetical protein
LQCLLFLPEVVVPGSNLLTCHGSSLNSLMMTAFLPHWNLKFSLV